MSKPDASGPGPGPGPTFWRVLLGVAIFVAIASVVLIAVTPTAVGMYGTLFGMLWLMFTCIVQLRRLR